jgi:stage V sporulation protein G
MDITEVRVFKKESADKKLKAYATVTFDNAFVVRDIKIISGTKGLFVAMPSRKLRDACPKCGHGNVVRSKYCNECGSGLESIKQPLAADEATRQSEHRDIAHPITIECREYIQKKILEAYEQDSAQA